MSTKLIQRLFYRHCSYDFENDVPKHMPHTFYPDVLPARLNGQRCSPPPSIPGVRWDLCKVTEDGYLKEYYVKVLKGMDNGQVTSFQPNVVVEEEFIPTSETESEDTEEEEKDTCKEHTNLCQNLFMCVYCPLHNCKRCPWRIYDPDRYESMVLRGKISL